MNQNQIIDRIVEMLLELPIEEQLEILERAKEEAQVNWEETLSAGWEGFVP
jgi:hypothetical protein